MRTADVSNGSDYSLMDEIRAYDIEDGDITASVTISEVINPGGQAVTENDYNTAGNGKWTVIYKVTDNDGNVVYATGSISISGSNTGKTTHIVTFNANGGSSVNSVSVENGAKLTIPTAPTKSGYYLFAGWYADS